MSAAHKSKCRLGGRHSQEQTTSYSRDFPADALSPQALADEGEAYFGEFLNRLHAGQADPAQLAALLSFLSGEMLHGACRAIVTALKGGRHA